MTAAEIHAIIASCARANVRRISVPGLHLELGEETQKVAVTAPKVAEPTRTTEATLSDKQHDEQTRESLFADELRLKQERLDLMLIEDPVEHERLMLSGELEELTSEGNDE